MKEIKVQEICSQIIHLPGRPPAMLDSAIAEFYGVTTREVNQAVSRNPKKFPQDFCFQMSSEEVDHVRKSSSPIVIKYSGEKIRPHAFTREGCNMLATILGSDIAIERCIQIIRIFSAMERDAFLHHCADSEAPGRITGERFDLSVKRFKVALEAVKLMGISNQSEVRRIANQVTKDTTGVDLMAFILPYCSPDHKDSKSEIIHHHEASKEDATLNRFVTEWWDRFGDNAVDSAHLYQLIAERNIPIDLGNGDPRSQKIRLGKLLAKLSGQQIGNYVITDAGKHRNTRLWKIKPVEKTVIGS